MKNILIADDHAIIRKGLKQILLEEYPAAVISEAIDAEEVIKKIIKGKFDVIICDLSMPGRSGLDVLHYVKNNCPEIPVLILSIYPEEQYAIRVLKAGAAGYLSKGSTPEELVIAVQRVMQGRKYISAAIAEKMVEDLGHVYSDKPASEFLSDREFGVFKAIAGGISVSHIPGNFPGCCFNAHLVPRRAASQFCLDNVKNSYTKPAFLNRYNPVIHQFFFGKNCIVEI